MIESDRPALRIVALDGYTLNPGDLDWAGLKSLGECRIHDRSTPEEVLSRAESAEIVLTNKTPLPRSIIESLPNLKYIGVLATGFNIVDAAAARARDIPVTNIPAYGTRSVAQMTIALLLELCHATGRHERSVAEGDWARCPDFSYWCQPLIELDGLSMGIVGLGRIGRAVAHLAQAFGMQVHASTRRPAEAPPGIATMPLDNLFRESDVISLHCPLTEETKGLVNTARLDTMKTTAFILNTSRGPLIDETALAEALEHGKIAGAGLDVLAMEPPQSNHPLFRTKNCIITPHIAWATQSARRRLMNTAVENVRAFLQGSPVNVVN